MELNSQIVKCPRCKIIVSENDYFCRNCGLALKSRLEDTSILKQILIYFVSFFLAPFGLGYTFSYLRRSDKKSKIIGAVSLILTILAIIVIIYLGYMYIKQKYGQLNLINNGGL
jgi:uncharacterized transporter YbjL